MCFNTGGSIFHFPGLLPEGVTMRSLSRIDGGLKGFAAFSCGIGTLLYSITLNDASTRWAIFAAVVGPVVGQGIWRWYRNRCQAEVRR